MEKQITEKQIEAYLVKKIKQLGGKAYKFVSPGNAGVPDRILVLPGGKIIFAELKRSGGKTTPLQDVQITTLKKLGCDVGIVSSIEEADDCIEYCWRQIGGDAT